MNPILLDRLETGFGKLIAALDDYDADRIIAAAATIRAMTTGLDDGASSHPPADQRAQLKRLLRLIEASRFKVKNLTDSSKFPAGNLARPYSDSRPKNCPTAR